jgi:hypothetical protein
MLTGFLVRSGIRSTSRVLFKQANSYQQLQPGKVEGELVLGRELDIEAGKPLVCFAASTGRNWKRNEGFVLLDQ